MINTNRAQTPTVLLTPTTNPRAASWLMTDPNIPHGFVGLRITKRDEDQPADLIYTIKGKLLTSNDYTILGIIDANEPKTELRWDKNFTEVRAEPTHIGTNYNIHSYQLAVVQVQY